MPKSTSIACNIPRLAVRLLRAALMSAAITGFCTQVSMAQSSCTDLQTEQARINPDKLRLVAKDPTLVAVLFGCAVYAKAGSESEQLPRLMGCGGFTCLFALERCLSLAADVIEVVGREQSVQQQMREQDC